MCGRLTQYRSWQEIQDFYDLVGAPQNLEPRYNIAPTMPVGTIRLGDTGREHLAMRWWLVPGWWKKTLREVPSTFNAKAEGIETKPMFRAAFRARRCIVWADGFYEWKREGAAKTPFYITRADGAPMSLAGLWEEWTNPEDGEILTSCTVITCPANALVARIHTRMPVILERDRLDDWLAARSGTEALVHAGEAVLAAAEVTRYVNNARHEGAGCIAPAG